MMVPPSLTPYERLVVAGKVRAASGSPGDLRGIQRTALSSRASADIIADVRGENGR